MKPHELVEIYATPEDISRGLIALSHNEVLMANALRMTLREYAHAVATEVVCDTCGQRNMIRRTTIEDFEVEHALEAHCNGRLEVARKP